MIYFRLKRPAQIAMIGAALAGPGCFQSYPEMVEADAGDTRDGRDAPDARDGADTPLDGDIPDVPEASDDAGPDMVVDCVPYPNCSDVDVGALAVTSVEAAAGYGVAQVVLNAPAIPYYSPVECATFPCLDVAPSDGRGTVSEITAVDRTTYRFRYTNAAMTYMDPEQLTLTWHVYCEDPAIGFRETVVTGTAWACRDASNNILVTSSGAECPSVDDPVPPPMAANDPRPRGGSSGALSLRARPERDGAVRLNAVGPAGTRSFRWIASGGVLRLLSDDEALFTPAPDAGLQVVQVAAFTPDGVSIQVYRRRG